MTIKTTYNRKRRVITDHHLSCIRESSTKNRAEIPEMVEIHMENSYKPEDRYTLDKILNDYLVNLNVLIFWRRKYDAEISINLAIKTLARKLGRDLSEKWSDLALFLTQYNCNTLATDEQFPYPSTKDFVNSSYTFRRDAIITLRKEAVKELKNLLEDKK